MLRRYKPSAEEVGWQKADVLIVVEHKDQIIPLRLMLCLSKCDQTWTACAEEKTQNLSQQFSNYTSWFV